MLDFARWGGCTIGPGLTRHRHLGKIDHAVSRHVALEPPAVRKAARIARKRPAVAILAVTPDAAVSRRLCLLWGAHSVLSQDIGSYEEMVERAVAATVEESFAQRGDSIVIVAGVPFGQAGTTNNLRVVQV